MDTARETSSLTPSGARTSCTSRSTSEPHAISRRRVYSVNLWRKRSCSACAARYPLSRCRLSVWRSRPNFTAMAYPTPILKAPPTISANPPMYTNLLEPNDESPAVRANGTVRPSDRPMILSDKTILASSCSHSETGNHSHISHDIMRYQMTLFRHRIPTARRPRRRITLVVDTRRRTCIPRPGPIITTPRAILRNQGCPFIGYFPNTFTGCSGLPVLLGFR